MTDQTGKSLHEAKEVRDMALEVSRLRNALSKLLREKHQLRETLTVNPELHDMISRLQERDRQFKDALRETVGALKTTIASLEDLIEQDVETAAGTTSDEHSMSVGEQDDSVPPPPQSVHVVDEGYFRWRPMRSLSDGTIEIDTPAGRMRFMDQLHAEEYFDAHWPVRKK